MGSILSKGTKNYSSQEIATGGLLLNGNGSKTLFEPDVDNLLFAYKRMLARKKATNIFLSFIPDGANAVKSFTYAEVDTMVNNLANAIEEFKLYSIIDDDVGGKLKVIGVMAATRVEWLILTIASWHCNVTLIPLYPTLGEEAILHILGQTDIESIFISQSNIPSIITLLEGKKTKLHTLISFDDNEIKNENYKIWYYNELLTKGTYIKSQLPLPEKNPIAQICYTSGTTGVPKGVVTTHKMILSYDLGMVSTKWINDAFHDRVYFSFLPMAHAMESNAQIGMMFAGCRICFARGDVRKLAEDMKIYNPHLASFVPRIVTRITAMVDSKINELQGWKKSLTMRAYNSKLYYLKKTGQVSNFVYDKLVFSKMKSIIGGKLEQVVCGSAPIPLDAFEKFQIYFSANLIVGYGLTESCGAVCLRPTDQPNLCSGPPLCCAQLKVVDCIEKNYFITDKPEPRGVLMIKANSLFSRYFKNEEETKKCISDGWFCTGDICAVTSDGSIKIFDRVKNLIKLSQGEYISPEKLEGLYSKSLLIAQIFVYGNSYEADLIAVIVPDQDQAMKWSKAMKLDNQSFDDVCKNDKFKMTIAEDLLKISKENKLSRWEFPKNLYLSPIAFSVQLNTLTPTLKLKRDEAFKFHRQSIENTYKLGYLFPNK